MKEIIIKKYEANDGKVFESKDNCIEYEEQLAHMKCFKIDYSPELLTTRENFKYRSSRYVLLNSPVYHREIIECYAQRLANSILSVNYNNELIPSYRIVEMTPDSFNIQTNCKEPGHYDFLSDKEVTFFIKPISIREIIKG